MVLRRSPAVRNNGDRGHALLHLDGPHDPRALEVKKTQEAVGEADDGVPAPMDELGGGGRGGGVESTVAGGTAGGRGKGG